jgi:molybdate transport repressor ModE-like protein
MHFELTDLRLFRHVAEAGSITHGAARAGLALAAASARIRNMEAAFGATVFERSRAGVRLTPAGQALLVHARTMLTQAERLREEMQIFAGGGAGHIRLLSNTNALSSFLPEALGRFLACNPRVSIDVEERLSDEIVGLVAEGVADLGIVAATVDTAFLETFPFRSDRFVVVVPQQHDLGRRASVAFAELLDEDFVGLERASALQRFLANHARRAGRQLKLRVQARSFDGVCRLVEAGVGIGIVPETILKESGRSASLAELALTDDWARRELRICTRNLAELSPRARELVEHLSRSGGNPQAA